MSKHTISHASQIMCGDGVALNNGLTGDELGNSLRGIRMAVLVTEAFQAGMTDLEAVSLNQTPAAGGEQELLVNGNEVVDGVAVLRFCGRVSITSSGADAGRTFTILGRDANGRPQAEERAGPATTTVESVKHFTKVDRVFVDADTAGVISVGQLETGPRGLRRRALAWPPSFLFFAETHLAVEGSSVVITGSYDSGNATTQTATNADQRADYQPVSFTQNTEVTYLADLTKDGIGENYTDSRQRTFSAI